MSITINEINECHLNTTLKRDRIHNKNLQRLRIITLIVIGRSNIRTKKGTETQKSISLSNVLFDDQLNEQTNVFKLFFKK